MLLAVKVTWSPEQTGFGVATDDVMVGKAFTVKLIVETEVQLPAIPVNINGYIPAAEGVVVNAAPADGEAIPEPA